MNKLKIVLIFCLIFPLSSCYNYEEIEDSVTVSAIAIDKGENEKYQISIELIKSGESGTNETGVISGEGKTVHGAIYKLINLLNNNIYLGHCESLIISEKIATNGISDILNYFMANTEFPKDLLVFVSRTDTAKEILEGNNANGKIVGYEIKTSVKSDKEHQGSSIYSPLFKVLSAIERNKGAALISAIEIKEDNIKTGGCYYLCKDKSAGYLSLEETQILNIIRGESEEVKLTLEYNSNNYGITFDDISASTKKVDNKIEIKIKLKMSVLETNGEKLTIQNAEKEVLKKVENLIEKMQKNKQIDVFKIATLYNKEGENWQNYFSLLEINPIIQIKTKGSGIIDE